MVIPDEAARLTLYCDHGENASRTIDVQTRTDLDTIAKALRAAAGWAADSEQYRMQVGGKLFGNPRGRSQPQVTRGKTTPLERMLKTANEFTFRSNLRSKIEHRVQLTGRHTRVWRASDYPLLIDIQGEMDLHGIPKPWDNMIGRVNSPKNEEHLEATGRTRADQLASLIDLELEMIRGPRRGPIESHEPGNARGWRERIESPPPAEIQAAEISERREAADAKLNFIDTRHNYVGERWADDLTTRQGRPCLVEQVALRRKKWCTRQGCPGCREDRLFGNLLRNSEVWYTRIQDKEVTTRLSHTRLNAAVAADELAALIKLVNTTAIEEDPSGERKIAGWIAPPGASWADYTDRYGFTPILLQPAEAPGPPGWTRISPWPS